MPTIGEQLKLARESRKLTVKQAGQATRLRVHYLQAMEDDDFSAMPSSAQARGFLRMYAEFLEMDVDVLINRLRVETHSEPAPLIPIKKVEPAAAATPKIRPKPVLPKVVAPDESDTVKNPGSPPVPSQAIFDEIGATLRSRRELISLTLDEVERHTRIRKHNLELIEAGNFDQLSSPVQLRGTLGTYASFLDLDTDALLLRYADAIQSRRIERQGNDIRKSAIRRTPMRMPLWLRHFISPDLIFGGSMILLLLALSIWGAGRILSASPQVLSTPTQGRSISDVLLASPAVSPTSQDGPSASLKEAGGTPIAGLDTTQSPPTETPITTNPTGVGVTVVVMERTFLRVTVDGEVKQEGRASPGAALNFVGSNQIEVLTGSGSAVQIIFNQSNLGVMGNLGEVVDRIYTLNGIETPTPTPSPTPSITAKPSITLRPTSTSRPTATPRPTVTQRPAVVNP